MSANEICFMSAKEMADRIRKKELSCREVMEAHLAQIDRVNPKVNAIVTRIEPEEALIKADVADRIVARGDELGPLHGLPIAHKDLVPTKGLRTTFGSPIFKDFMPDHDGLIVERLREAGTLLIGKTNTPEFGAGSQTYNEVFGETLNPYDTTRTCGGSSGGAAVSLACGMLPVADGSDMGGSLRNPANFNNIVGFRPSPGRVPQWPTFTGWSPLAVEGPMARSVEDLALLLSAIAGPDDRSPIALSEPGEIFRRPLDRDFKGVRIAWSPDLGGVPVDTRVADVLKSGIPVFEDLGCVVEEKTPDLTDADMIFKVLRAWCFEVSHHETIKSNRRPHEGNGDLEHRGRSKTHRAGSRPSGGEKNGTVPQGARIHEYLRISALPGEPGPALRREDPLDRRNQRRQDGQLHRLDENLLFHHGHRPPGDFCSLRIHAGRASRGDTDRRQAQGRFRRAPARTRIRKGRPVRGKDARK